MAEGIRLVSVRRGVDPRRFALLAFGGAAGLHVAEVARQLDLTRVVVPRVAAVLSAWGMLATDLRFECRARISATRAARTALASSGCSPRWSRKGRRLRASFDGPVRVQRSVEMRYGEQIFEINVPLDDMDWSVADPCRRSSSGSTTGMRNSTPTHCANRSAVLVNARAAVIGVLPGVPQEPILPPQSDASPRGERRIWLRGWTKVPVFAFDDLASGQAIGGPAIVESTMTTVLLRPGNRATITPHGWLDIDVR